MKEHYTLIVAGGGIGGVAAAVTAGRMGCDTLLIERDFVLGGIPVHSLISSFSQPIPPGARGKTFLEELQEGLDLRHARVGTEFSSAVLALLLDELCASSSVTVRFGTTLTGCRSVAGRIESLKIFDCGGFHEISADYFIDGTGDGALAVMAGAEFELGRESDGECQPMTMAFYLSGIDSGKMPPIEEINRAYYAAKKAGTVKNPRENVLFFATPEPGVYQFNTTRIIRRNPTDPEALSEAQREGRRQVEEMVRFLRTLPGFQNARLSQLASQIGVRESRRIRCDYRFTLEDMYGARRFPDGIVRSTAHPDIHNPVGEGTWFEPLPAGVEDYEIPFRSLLPEKLENLTIGSRCIGCSHEAFSAVRMIGHVGEYGRAAGIASAWAAAHRSTPREVPGRYLRSQLGMEPFPIPAVSIQENVFSRVKGIAK